MTGWRIREHIQHTYNEPYMITLVPPTSLHIAFTEPCL